MARLMNSLPLLHRAAGAPNTQTHRYGRDALALREPHELREPGGPGWYESSLELERGLLVCEVAGEEFERVLAEARLAWQALASRLSASIDQRRLRTAAPSSMTAIA